MLAIRPGRRIVWLAFVIGLGGVLAGAAEVRPLLASAPAAAAFQSGTLDDALLAEADTRQVVQFNPNAALQKQLFADGFVPNSAEFTVEVGRDSRAAQRAEHLGSGRVRVYSTVVGNWSSVEYVERGNEGGDLATTLLAEAETRQVIQFNPAAALQKTIFSHGFVPNSPEFQVQFSGVAYTAQRAEHLGSGQVRVYYVAVPDWGNVRFAQRGATASPVGQRGPRVVTFIASPGETQNIGDPVTLRWEAVGDSAEICPYDGAGPWGDCTGVPLSGALTITTTEPMMRYLGWALRVSGNSVSVLATAPVRLQCRNLRQWFFSPPPARCPQNEVSTSEAAYQRFEGGMMVWVKANDTFRVFFSRDPDPFPRTYAMLWGPYHIKPGGSVDNRVGETPPPGRYEPVSGFGLLWRGELEASSSPPIPRLRERLGWAIEPEGVYEFAIQSEILGHPHLWADYMRAPNGAILRLSPDSTAQVRQLWDER